jgi:hypothetical protein
VFAGINPQAEVCATGGGQQLRPVEASKLKRNYVLGLPLRPGREGNAMSRLFKMSAIALLSLFFLVPAASAHSRGGFVGVYGPGWGWYGPGWGWYGPYGWGWGYPYGYAAILNRGEVKIENVAKDTLVYVDGGYAGTAGKLKKFPLRPGNHTIELRDPSGHTFHQERVQVLLGKTLEINGAVRGH